MSTITLKINERSNMGKALLELIRTTAKESKAVEIIEEKSPYKPEFVKMVKKAAASKNRTRINPSNVWESL
jgi:hypothetical protein